MATVTLLVNVQHTQTVIADLIERQINDNYNYIFLRRTLNASVQRVSRFGNTNEPLIEQYSKCASTSQSTLS